MKRVQRDRRTPTVACSILVAAGRSADVAASRCRSAAHRASGGAAAAGTLHGAARHRAVGRAGMGGCGRAVRLGALCRPGEGRAVLSGGYGDRRSEHEDGRDSGRDLD